LISAFEAIAGPFGDIAEGPVWDGKALVFTLIRQSRILRYDPRTQDCIEVAAETRRTNGLAQAADGRLFGCSAQGRAIVQIEGGRIEPVVESCGGTRLNTPNDLVVDSQGRIWFSNPWNPPLAPEDEAPELPQEVYRADPDGNGGWRVRRCTHDMTKPNGLLLSQDERVLYVAQSDFAENRPRELRAYPVLGDDLGPYLTLHSFGIDHRGVQRGIDGMRLDAAGNIVATAGWPQSGPGPLIYVFSPTGRVLATRELPPTEGPTNCAFGGPDLRTLFVTTVDGHLLAARTEIPGWPIGVLSRR